MKTFEVTVMVLLFVLYALILYRPIKKGFALESGTGFIVSMCVAGLAVIGLLHTSDGLVRMILIPHVATAIALIFLLLCSFIRKFRLATEERFNDRSYNDERIGSDQLRK